jgi:transcriptional regulator with XRE-family HTH domain
LSVNISFGECLSSILQALNLRSSKLAREINIDPSLVYKWLRDERVPSYETRYIDQIIEYITKRITNTYQKEELLNLLIKYGVDLSYAKGTDISDLLRKMLLEAQGYSIMQHKAGKQNAKKAADTRNSIDTTKYISQEEVALGSSTVSEIMPGLSDSIKIIKSQNKISNAEIELLEKAACTTPVPGDNTILITYNIEMDIINTDNWISSWINTLVRLMDRGWRIVLQIILGYNTKIEMIIIEALQVLMTHGNIAIYCQTSKDHVNLVHKEFIVPGIGALVCYPPVNEPKVSSRAFLYNSRESIITLTEHFACRMNTAKPLIKSFPPQKTAEFQQAFVEAEETLGDKYVVKAGLSTLTLPAGLYEKYLAMSGKSVNEISYRLFLHKRRLESFNSQIKYYKYRDICFSESLDKLANEHKYSFDGYIFESTAPDAPDIENHLQNVIDMLQKHDNYELAIISKKQFKHFTDINWAVKDHNCILIESNATLSADGSHRSERNITITEKNTVFAFADYFRMIWEQIPESCKDKTESIKRLKDYIKAVRQHGTDR